MPGPIRDFFDRMFGGPAVTEAPIRMNQDVFTAPLPSAAPHAEFQGQFSVWWHGRPGEQERERRLIRKALPDWAAKHTTNHSIGRLDIAQRELGFAISQVTSINGSPVRVTTASVTLSATPQAQQMSQEWEQLERQRAQARLRRQLELDELAYLREEIYSRPETARAYWLKHHPNALNDLLDDRFERIADALRAAPAGPATQPDVARILSEFVGGLTSADRSYLIDQVARVFSSFDRQDLADRLPGGSAPGDRGSATGPRAGSVPGQASGPVTEPVYQSGGRGEPVHSSPGRIHPGADGVTQHEWRGGE